MDAAGLSDSNLYFAASKQGNIFSQSYNLCTNSYMAGGEFISVPNTNADDGCDSSMMSANMEDCEVSNSLQVTSMLSESKHWIVVQLPVAYMATNWPIRVSFFLLQPNFNDFNKLNYFTVQCN